MNINKQYKEIKGDLCSIALEGKFEVIVQGCNCFCLQKAGLAKQFSKIFKTDNGKYFLLESDKYKGIIKKLGTYSANKGTVLNNKYFLEYELGTKSLVVINAYTQYLPGANAQYNALELCLQKINHDFKGKIIGLPLIGCGIGGLDFKKVRKIIKKELKDCFVTVVRYEKK